MRSSTVMVIAPPVVMLITALVAALIRGRNWRNRSGSPDGRPFSGSRACRCRMAAPDSAASIAEAAIWSGVTGKYGDIEGVWIAPVIAQVMMTLLDNAGSSLAETVGGGRPSADV